MGNEKCQRTGTKILPFSVFLHNLLFFSSVWFQIINSKGRKCKNKEHPQMSTLGMKPLHSDSKQLPEGQYRWSYLACYISVDSRESGEVCKDLRYLFINALAPIRFLWFIFDTFVLHFPGRGSSKQSLWQSSCKAAGSLCWIPGLSMIQSKQRSGKEGAAPSKGSEHTGMVYSVASP